ncbi:MAG: hypothetical protein QXH98_05660 [Candidatus Korarchaeota archaeon]
MRRLLIGLLILIVAIYSASGVIAENIPITKTFSQTELINEEPIVAWSGCRYETVPSVYSAFISDSTISGIVEVANESKVLIQNVEFIDSPLIIVRDNACVILENFRLLSGGLTIMLLDNSYLKLAEGDTLGALSIIMNGSSKALIRAPYTYYTAWIECFEHSRLYIEADLRMSEIKLHDNATAYISEINFHCTIQAYDHSVAILNKTYSDSSSNMFYAYGSSRITLTEAHLNQTYVFLYNMAYLHSKNSELYSIEMHDCSLAHIERNEIYSVYSTSRGNLTIISSFIDYLQTNMYIESSIPSIYSGAYIMNSTVFEVALYSPGITYLVNSEISILEYLVIHNGTLIVNETHVISTSNYTNFVNVSSSIESAYILSKFVADNASLVIINRYSADVLLIGVESAKIYDASTVTSLKSNVFVENTTMPGTFFMYDNTDLHVRNSTLQNSSVLTSNSRIFVESSQLYLNNITLLKSEAEFKDATISAQGVLAVESNIYLNRTNTMIEDMNINGRIIFEGSNATITRAYVAFILINGSFVISNGIITSATNLDGILSGIFARETNILINENNIYSIGAIRCNLIFENYSALSSSLIELQDHSNLTIKANIKPLIRIVTHDFSEIKIENSSLEGVYGKYAVIEIKNSSMNYLSLDESHGIIYRSSISGITIDKIDIEVSESTINIIEALEGSVRINHSNVGEVELGTPQDYFVAHKIRATALFVDGSEIDRIASFGGTIHIANSTVGSIISIFTNVSITNHSNVDFAWENFLITATGNVVINSNYIPPGTYVCLLSVDASSNVNMTEPVILTNVSALNLTIINSSFVAIWGLNAALHVINSTIATVLRLLEAQCVELTHVYVDAAAVEGNIIRINNLTAQHLLILGAENAIIQNFSVEYIFCAPNLEMIMDPWVIPPEPMPTTYIDLSTGDAYFASLLYVSGSIKNTHIENAHTLCASVSLNEAILSTLHAIYSNLTITTSTILGLMLYESTHITIYDSSVQFIETHTWTWDYPIYPMDEYLHAIKSTINTTYVHYSIIDAIVSLQGPRLDVPFLRTIYENTTLGELRSAIIDIYGLSLVNITGFKNVTIEALRVYCKMDKKPPIITVQVSTPIVYELGIEKNLIFTINDDSPKEYWILLNDSEVLRNTYSSGVQITISLQDFINSPGNYLARIYASDQFGNVNSVDVPIIVYPMEPPVIVFAPPRIINITVGESIELSWTARDASPNTYKLYIDGNLSASGAWLSDIPVKYNFTASEVRKYNVTIIFKDQLDQTTVDSIIINVKPTPAPVTMTAIIAIVAIVGLAALAAFLLRRRRA